MFGEENKKKHNDTLKKERCGKINDEDNFTRRKNLNIENEDFFCRLKVDPLTTDDDEEIKSQYRKLCLAYHPDKQGGDKTKFQNLKEAYDLLKDSEIRNIYLI